MLTRCSSEDTKAHAYENQNIERVAEDNLAHIFVMADEVENMDLDDFSRLFAESEVAKAFETGNPIYIYGKSDDELLDMILGREPREHDCYFPISDASFIAKVYAFAQWRLNVPYKTLVEACPPSELYKYGCSRYWEGDPAECLDVFRRYLPEEVFEGIVDLHPEW